MAKGTTMTGATKRKDHPLSMRLPEGDLAIIDRAADLRGRSRTDFVREAAVRAAEEVLMESTLLRSKRSLNDGLALASERYAAAGRVA